MNRRVRTRARSFVLGSAALVVVWAGSHAGKLDPPGPPGPPVKTPAGIPVENIDPANDGSQFAWGENVGWLNAEPANCSGCGLHVSDLDVTGWMWGENVGWVSLACDNTLSCGTTDYGVTNDGLGVLSGMAWSENVGWINFSPSSAGVSVDPQTGEFAGRAWGENVGWITFASSGSNPFKVSTSWRCTDGDSDGYCAAVDCGDDNAAVYPGAAELCDGVDNDCDTEVDEAMIGALPDGTLWAIPCQRFKENAGPRKPPASRPRSKTGRD